MKFFYHIFILAVLLSLALFISQNVALAADNYGLDTTANQAFNNTTIPHSPDKADPGATIGRIIGIALSFVGIIFLILVIYGGFIWMTAGGNEEKVKQAIDLVTQAGIGLAIVLAAYLLTKYLGGAILNALR